MANCRAGADFIEKYFAKDAAKLQGWCDGAAAPAEEQPTAVKDVGTPPPGSRTQ